MDILAALETVLKLNTKHYQSDFKYDRESITKAAGSPESGDKHLLWLSRESGTWCFNEREVFISGSEAHIAWTYYQGLEQNIAAFAVEIVGTKDGKPVGTLYELGYNSHAEHVKKAALPVNAVSLIFEDGSTKCFPYERISGNWQSVQNTHGNITDMRYEIADEAALQALLKQDRVARSRFPARSFNGYIKRLSAVTKPSAVERLDAAKKAVKHPSPANRRVAAEAEL